MRRALTAARPPARTAPAAGLVPPSGPYVRWGKGLLDRTLGLVALVLLLPVLLVVAAAVLVRTGRPVLFRQERVGRDGRPFTILKFRTMGPDRRREQRPIAHPERRGYHKSDDDPRHTPLGRRLRRYSLDEFPQLVNVLRGEMSLVGPRPELPAVVRTYRERDHVRHAVRPGLTGPWQTSARDDRPMHEFLHLDLDYVARVSLRHDLALLLRTVPALLRRPGR